MQKASFSSVLRCHLWRMHWIIFKQFDPKCSIPVRLLHNWYERIGENQFATKDDSKELFICAILCREQYGLRYYLLGDFELHCDDLLQISKWYERTCTVLVSQNEYYVVDWYYIATVHRSPFTLQRSVYILEGRIAIWNYVVVCGWADWKSIPWWYWYTHT